MGLIRRLIPKPVKRWYRAKRFAWLQRSYRRIWNVMASEDALNAILEGTESEKDFDRAGEEDAKWLLDLIGKDKVILDLGCGVGRIEKFLGPHCKQLFAADVSTVMLDRAKQRLTGISNIHFILLNGNGILPNPDESIDAIFSLLVLQHMQREDVFRYLLEFNRVLKPEGICVIQFPDLTSENYFATFIRSVAIQMHQRAIARPRLYTSEEVECYLTWSGFQVENIFKRGSDMIAIARRSQKTTLADLKSRAAIDQTEWDKIIGNP